MPAANRVTNFEGVWAACFEGVLRRMPASDCVTNFEGVLGMPAPNSMTSFEDVWDVTSLESILRRMPAANGMTGFDINGFGDGDVAQSQCDGHKNCLRVHVDSLVKRY